MHLVTQAANDLNLTFVVDEDQSERLVRQLHGLLLRRSQGEGPLFGPTWSELFGGGGGGRRPDAATGGARRRDELLALAAARRAALRLRRRDRCERRPRSLRSLDAVARVFYCGQGELPTRRAARASSAQGSASSASRAAELEHVLAVLPGHRPRRLLFTPNFAPREEYAPRASSGAPG